MTAVKWLVIQFYITGLMLSLVSTQTCAEITVEMSVQRIVTDVKGTETRTNAHVAKPGEILEYHVTYRNNGAQDVRLVQAVLPIPAGTVSYISGSADPSRVYASLDGKRYSAVPLMRSVKLANGKRELRPVPSEEYRYLKWNLGDMAPGAKTDVVARMRLLTVKTPTSGNIQ